MLKAAENLVAHIVVLEQAFDASKHALAGQVWWPLSAASTQPSN